MKNLVKLLTIVFLLFSLSNVYSQNAKKGWDGTVKGNITAESPNSESNITVDKSRNITFRWTPLVPKPKGSITYRLKVWQLMKGQSAATIMKKNTPILEKDVKDITQAVVSNLDYCKPIFLCDMIWRVEAMDEDRKSLVISESTVFSLKE